MPSWTAGAPGRGGGLARALGGDPGHAATGWPSGCRAAPRSSPRTNPLDPGMLDQAVESLRAMHDSAARELRRPAQLPAGLGDRVPAAPRRDRDDLADAAGDGLGRPLRPARRRLCPLHGGRQLAHPPLREDALRQRAAGARLPARLAGHGRSALPHGLRGDARVGAARHARPGGRLLLRARRRLRGRGGALLPLDAGAAAGGAGRGLRRPRPTTTACSPGGNFEGRTILTRGSRTAREPRRPAPPAARSPRASASGRGSTTSG